MVEMALCGEEGVGNGAQLPPKQVCWKALISRQTLGHCSTLNLIQTF